MIHTIEQKSCGRTRSLITFRNPFILPGVAVLEICVATVTDH